MVINAGPRHEQVLSHVCKQLAFDFGDEFTEEAIHELVSESFDALSDARVQTYIPLLIHRSARERLRAAASTRKAAQAQPRNHTPTDHEAAS